MTDRSALHEDDRVMPVLAGHGRRQAKDIPGLRSPDQLLKARRRQVMAFVHDQMTVVPDTVIDHAGADEALDQRHVERAVRLVAAAADAADGLGRQSQEACQPFDPLLQQLLAVHEHQRADAAPGDQPRRDNGLAESGGRREYALVVAGQCLRGDRLPRPQGALERDAQRHAGVALVAHDAFDPEAAEQILDFVQAAAWQPDMQRMPLGAGDHPWLAEGRQAHRLRPVELGILERRQPQQAIAQGGWQSLPRKIDLVAEDQFQSFRQRPDDRGFGSAARGRRGPRFCVAFRVFVEHGTANPDDAAALLGGADNGLGLRTGDPLHGREKRPLIRPGKQPFVKEHAVVALPRALLQRQRDQVAEAALGQGVLVRNETVVRIQPDFRSSFHRLGEDVRSEFPRQDSRQSLGEEQPQVATVARARPLNRGRQPKLSAGLANGTDVRTPAFLVEVDGKKEAGLIEKHRVQADDELATTVVVAAKMLANGFVGQRQESPTGAVLAPDRPFVAETAHPLVGAGRAVTGLAGAEACEKARIEVVPSPKERPEQGDLGGYGGVMGDYGIGAHYRESRASD
ncbi:MAG: hypothetical protein AW07_01246 [Candidatus Accumulibacter sp. SK-11]|nr:MAG: hypothetical protein AW07_01246 [Candidatus Accumulibacter sp. SK-11]